MSQTYFSDKLSLLLTMLICEVEEGFKKNKVPLSNGPVFENLSGVNVNVSIKLMASPEYNIRVNGVFMTSCHSYTPREQMLFVSYN